MKTTKLMLAIIMLMIFSTGFSHIVPQRMLIKDIPVERKAKMIHYLVRIENASYLQSGAQYMIVMTDASGNQVTPAQAFHQGVTDYNFTEAGTVRDTRVARMFKLPGKLNASGIPPTALTGVFFGGGTYLFIIRPTAAENDNGNSKH